MRFISFIALCLILALGGCGDRKAGQANSSQGNISQESRVPPTANASEVTPSNGMTLSVASSRDQALKIMHDRHEAMEGLGKAMKTLHRELESGKPDIGAVRAQTATMAAAGAKIPSLFPAGTGPDVGKTRAKPEIWAKKDLFIQKAKDYAAAAQAIDAAARTGDLNKVMALHENVDKACKACHDPFRAPEH